MSFENAKTYEDLVKCTTLFLKGVLKKTPDYSAPLADESKLIKDELIELSEKGVLTFTSQPAISGDNWVQRGYLCGCFKSNGINNFIAKLRNSDLEYIVQYRDERYCNRKFNKHGRWGFTMSENSHGNTERSLITFSHKGEKKTMYCVTGLCMNDLDLMHGGAYSYDTEFYSLTDDNDIIYFYVCDPNFDCEPAHCCKTMINIFSSCDK